MSNASDIINEISNFLERFSLKTTELSKQDLISFIEEKWKQADEGKYAIHQGTIIIGRMTNEYIQAKDFKNMMRWLEMSDLHESSGKHPNYINNYYKGQCCLECGYEKEALKYFNLCYEENPDYIFTRAPFCYEFFNKQLDNPREISKQDDKEDQPIQNVLELKEWQTFFKEDSDSFHYTLFDSESEEVENATAIHTKGLEYLQDHQTKILYSILDSLKVHYPELQERYNYKGQKKQDFMPDVSERDDFYALLSPATFYVISDGKKEMPFIGYIFWCSWDSEHGLGIMTHKDLVLEIGGADCAFQVPFING